MKRKKMRWMAAAALGSSLWFAHTGFGFSEQLRGNDSWDAWDWSATHVHNLNAADWAAPERWATGWAAHWDPLVHDFGHAVHG